MTPVSLQLLLLLLPLHLHNTVSCGNKHKVTFHKAEFVFTDLKFSAHQGGFICSRVAAQMSVCSCLSGSGGSLSPEQQQQQPAPSSFSSAPSATHLSLFPTPTRSELGAELTVRENKFAATYCAFQASECVSSPI